MGKNKNRKKAEQLKKKQVDQAKVNVEINKKELTLADESGFEDTTNVSEITDDSFRDNLNYAILDESTEINIVNNNLMNNNNVSKTPVEVEKTSMVNSASASR